MAELKTALTLHSQYVVGQVDRRIFGGFIEHLGRCIYGGIYDPQSPLSDVHGFRIDVMDALRQLQFSVMRYPGGNFASAYHWQEGVGPRALRPRVLEPAWQSIESNQFGTDEFMAFCRQAGCEPMLTVNLGTGTPEEARQWLEYCNGRTGTRFADQRAAFGSKEPYGVKLWCLGNEMDGLWQIGYLPAGQYAIKAHQTAKLMRDVCGDIELVACGSTSEAMPTYLEWDRTVLEEIDYLVDYISLHCYLENTAADTADFLASPVKIDRHIEQVDAVCRAVHARKRSNKRVYLCFDEWNIWYREKNGKGGWVPSPPLLEEAYNLEDALAAAGVLNSFIRHADVLKIANLAQAVNVIAPILTGPDGLVRQTLFYPFQMYARRGRGISLMTRIQGPEYLSASFGRVPYIDTSAILDGSMLHVFAVNRHLSEAMELAVCLCDRPIACLLDAEVLTGMNPKAVNSFQTPDNIKSAVFKDVVIERGTATVTMPPLSLAAMTFRLH